MEARAGVMLPATVSGENRRAGEDARGASRRVPQGGEPTTIAIPEEIASTGTVEVLRRLLLAVIKGCQRAAPPNRTEALWEDFITCLKDQDLYLLQRLRPSLATS